MGESILTLNSGSSSLKFALYPARSGDAAMLEGNLARIGLRDGTFVCRDDAGRVLVDRKIDLPDHAAAIAVLGEWLRGQVGGGGGETVAAVGHRIVHGGEMTEPQVVDESVMDALRSVARFAPNHVPAQIAVIEQTARALPGVPQVLCFDTAFHRTMPAVAQTLPLPREYRERGVMRHGFHGLSYQYIVEHLGDAARGKMVAAHLGNGASMAAIVDGKSVDTTMGMTPIGGLVMSTRSGDLDPGVVTFLGRDQKLSAEQIDELLSKQSGLLGVSGTSADMRDLLERRATDANAALAVEMFCYQAGKFIGALAAAMGGIETLVFAGGIGEHAAAVRAEICRPLGFLGIELDAARNGAGGEAVISTAASRVSVRIVETNEELMIARLTRAAWSSDKV